MRFTSGVAAAACSQRRRVVGRLLSAPVSAAAPSVPEPCSTSVVSGGLGAGMGSWSPAGDDSALGEAGRPLFLLPLLTFLGSIFFIAALCVLQSVNGPCRPLSLGNLLQTRALWLAGISCKVLPFLHPGCIAEPPHAQHHGPPAADGSRYPGDTTSIDIVVWLRCRCGHGVRR